MRVFDADWYEKQNGDFGTEPLGHYLEHGWKEGRNPHPLFSVRWYLARYPDVAEAGTEPLGHYLEHGWKEGRNPHPLFSVRWYLERYPDVAEAGMEPLGHYLEYGWKARCNPHPLFEVDWYLANNSDVAEGGVEPLSHYLEYGWQGRCNPHPLFEVDWFLAENHDIADAGVEPLGHYVEYGWKEGRNPHPLFHVHFYLSQAPHLFEINIEPLAHFLKTGAQQGIKPNPLFDPLWYAGFNRESMLSRENALVHYVTKGWNEGCDPHPSFSISLYLEENPEVRSRKKDPLVDYFRRGASAHLMPDISSEPPSVELEAPRPDVKAIAFYLPQFHSIPENDKWWGNGFTEWTHVRRGRPQFWDHYQPHVPHKDIGYYDLTDPGVMDRQVQMATKFGIYGFCFYYYWFDGRRLLEMPTNRYIASGEPDFPFCFCWANHHWTRRWDGHEGEVLIAQKDSDGSDERFIRDMLPAFRDQRYIRINGRPLLVLYRPGLLSDHKATFTYWREFCRAEGIGEIYLAGFQAFDLQDPEEFGMDAAVECPHHSLEIPTTDSYRNDMFNSFAGCVCDYQKVSDKCLNAPMGNYRLFRGVMPSWDNTARREQQGIIFTGSNPQTYSRWLHRAVLRTRQLLNPDERLIFINAWNEWGEGAHLEPDARYGYAWLNATRLALEAGGPTQNSSKHLWSMKENFNRDLTVFLENNNRLLFPLEAAPDVSVIVVLFNQAEFILPCLRAVLAQIAVSFEVLLVDDGSTDQTSEILMHLDNVRVLRNREKVGFSLAANQAAAEARGRAVLLLSGGSFMRENALTMALQTLDSDDRIGAVGGKLVLPSGEVQEAGNVIWNDASVQAYGRNLAPDATETMFRRDVDYCSSAFLLTRSVVFEQMGGLDAAYAPGCYEEADYCLRLWQAGRRVVYEPRAVVDHYEFGCQSRSESVTALMRRDRKRFRLKHTDTLQLEHLPRSEGNVLFARTHVNNRRRLLVIDNEVPLTALGQGYPRMCAFLNEVVAAGWFVTLYPLDVPKTSWEAAHAELPLEMEVCVGRGASGLAGFLAERLGYYDTILVSRPYNMELFQKAVRNQQHLLGAARLIYDAEAIAASRDMLQAELEGRSVSAREADALIAREIKLTAGADAIVAVSQTEAQLLRERQSAPVHTLCYPTCVRWDTPGWKERTGFLFVGRLLEKTWPNYEGLVWFLRSAWPKIRAALPEAVLLVVGAVHAQPIELMGPGVQLSGQVEDLLPLYDRARVFLSPIRFAAGVPLKILGASASGLPVVGTKLMATQLGWQPGVEIEAADDSVEMASAAIALHCDAKRWEVMRCAALHRLTREYSEAHFRRELRALLDYPAPASMRQIGRGEEGGFLARSS